MESKGQVDPTDVFSRILEALQARNAPEIGRKLGISKQAVYEWQKTTPGLENLIKISKASGASLHWLLTGEGERQVFGRPEQVNLDDTFRKVVREVVREEISGGQPMQQLGTIDDFDIAAAVKKHDNASKVLELWYTYDHEPIPELGAIAFKGWSQMTLDEKVREIRAARGIMERQRERQKMYAPKKS